MPFPELAPGEAWRFDEDTVSRLWEEAEAAGIHGPELRNEVRRRARILLEDGKRASRVAVWNPTHGFNDENGWVYTLGWASDRLGEGLVLVRVM